jgi:prepilin-type N-terminal cleavage/methylation domain-containing protein
MRLRASIHSFSLIELLTALSILAIVAGIIIPRYLSVLDQAKQAVVDSNLV